MAPEPTAASEPSRTDPRTSKRIEMLKRRAFEELNFAAEEAGPELTRDWLLRDPDLKTLRANDDSNDWQLLLQRYYTASAEGMSGLPPPAWGRRHRRRTEWRLAALVSAAIFVLLALSGEFGWAAAALIVAALAGARASSTSREAAAAELREKSTAVSAKDDSPTKQHREPA
jgi:hypothetical protein